jgi:ribosomal protein S18 acetylase RimI-like enzyme
MPREPHPAVGAEPHLEPPVQRLRDRDAALAVYLRDPAIHPYGIADVVQLWDVSRWWRRGDALLGVMDLPGSTVPVIYAIAAQDAVGTLALFDALERRGELPARFVMTGPIGVSAALAPSRRAIWRRDYEKLAFPTGQPSPADDTRVRVLERADLARIEALFATDPAAGDFFHPGLLDTGHYLGIDRRAADGHTHGGGHGRQHGGAHGSPDALAAIAGIHVIERTHGVSAIGNVATDPLLRGRGLGRAVVAALTRRLHAEGIDTVGLNVTRGNEVARRLYRRIGFSPVLAYEEAELDRR